MAKNEIKPGCCSGFFPPMPFFGTVLYRNSTKDGALAFKIQLVGGANTTSRGSGLFAAKIPDFKNLIEVLKELGSL